MYYVGYNKTTKKHSVFTSKHKPTYESHGHLYAFCFGGYRTRRQAENIWGYESATFIRLANHQVIQCA